MNFKQLDSIKDMRGKRVLVREDYNVPMRGKKIVSDYKIERSIATLRYLEKRGAKIIIVSHLGRPHGVESTFSLKPVAARLEKYLNKKIHLQTSAELKSSWVDIVLKTKELKNGEILMLENIRFFKEEEKNTSTFSKKLAELGDVFVLDGFGVVHRDAASVTGVTQYIPTYAGFLLQEEVQALERVLQKPKHPVVVVLGGIKLETKLPLIKKLLPLADKILLAGGLANTYLWAQGYAVGNSLVEKQFKKEMLSLAQNKKIDVPVDVVVGAKQGNRVQQVTIDELRFVKNGFGIYDLGPKSIKVYTTYIREAQTIIWNGAVGFFEQTPYEKGTCALAKAIAQSSKKDAFAVCGGGETEEILRRLKILKHIDLVSTGGGAMLEYLSGKELPGLKIFGVT